MEKKVASEYDWDCHIHSTGQCRTFQPRQFGVNLVKGPQRQPDFSMINLQHHGSALLVLLFLPLLCCSIKHDWYDCLGPTLQTVLD